MGQIHFTSTGGDQRQISCVAQLTPDADIRIHLPPGDITSDELDPAHPCKVVFDTGSHTFATFLTIGQFENKQTLIAAPVSEVSHAQKRDFFRINTSVPVKISEPSAQSPDLLEVEGINLSGNGILVSFPGPVTLWPRVDLRIALPEDDSWEKEIHCICSVARVTDRPSGIRDVALHFEKISEEDQDRIIAFCLKEQRKELRLKVRVLGPPV